MPSCPVWPCDQRKVPGRNFCAEHDAQRQKAYDQNRGSAAKRGYGGRWRTYRIAFLAKHPVCNELGCTQPATDVDHIKPPPYPRHPLFWDKTNHQGLCHRHHSMKTAREDGRWTGRARR